MCPCFFSRFIHSNVKCHFFLYFNSKYSHSKSVVVVVDLCEKNSFFNTNKIHSNHHLNKK